MLTLYRNLLKAWVSEKKRYIECVVLAYFQLDEDTTEAGSQPAVKSDSFRVPPPPGYKPKPQTTASESSDMPVKKVRGTIFDRLIITYVKICSDKKCATTTGPALPHGQHWPAKTLPPNSLPPNMTATNLHWSEVPLHSWDCTVVIRVWNSSEEFQ